MAVLTGLSYLLFAFGPAIVFVFGVTGRSASYLIAAVTSSFFWLVSIILPSILYGAIPELQTSPAAVVFISVFFQETLRVIFIKLYYYAETYLLKRTSVTDSPFNRWGLAISSGLGFGVMASLVLYGGALSGAFQEDGHSDFYLDSCPEMSIYLVTAATAVAFQILHVGLMAIAYIALSKTIDGKGGMLIAITFALHMLMSFISLANEISGACVGVVVGQYLIAFCSVFLASSLQRVSAKTTRA